MSHFRYILYLAILWCCSSKIFAQSIPPNAGKKPLTITGHLGTGANFYSSNEDIDSRPAYSWNVNGNLLARVNKWSIPASFVINQYSRSNAPAFFQAGLSPNYKWATVHLGYRYMSFSPFTFEGQNFKGVGLELNPKHFRFSTFYGKINRAVDQDTSRTNFRLPQFSRTAYGIKAGYGTSSTYLDFIFFRAKDDSTSANVINNAARARPQENAVAATTFKVTLLRKIILSGDLAISGQMEDQASKRIIDTTHQNLKDFIKNFLKEDGAVKAGFAAQGALSYFVKSYYTNIGYRRVQPNFKSLGTPYMLNDVELVSWNNNVSFLKGKLNLSTNASQQHNNVDNSQATELVTQVGNINVNTILGQHFNINVNASGYNLKQKDGNLTIADPFKIPDTFRLNQRITQFSFSPGYHVTSNDIMHYINTNLNLSKLTDRNTSTAAFSNSNNLSTSVNYTIAFIKKSISLSLNTLYNKYKQQNNSYTSVGPTAGISAQLLKSKNLNLQGNVGVLFNNYNKTSKQKNLSYSVNSGYQAKHHAFSLFANYIHTETNNAITNAINKTFPYAVATKNLSGGVSYNYTF